jgi:protein-tyrosine phosphatase
VEYVRVYVDDHETAKIDLFFRRAYRFIENALTESPTNRVLVHCAYGISRSSSIVIMFLMKHYSIDYEEAFRHVKTCREIIEPNQGFRQ